MARSDCFGPAVVPQILLVDFLHPPAVLVVGCGICVRMLGLDDVVVDDLETLLEGCKSVP